MNLDRAPSKRWATNLPQYDEDDYDDYDDAQEVAASPRETPQHTTTQAPASTIYTAESDDLSSFAHIMSYSDDAVPPIKDVDQAIRDVEAGASSEVEIEPTVKNRVEVGGVEHIQAQPQEGTLRTPSILLATNTWAQRKQMLKNLKTKQEMSEEAPANFGTPGEWQAFEEPSVLNTLVEEEEDEQGRADAPRISIGGGSQADLRRHAEPQLELAPALARQFDNSHIPGSLLPGIEHAPVRPGGPKPASPPSKRNSSAEQILARNASNEGDDSHASNGKPGSILRDSQDFGSLVDSAALHDSRVRMPDVLDHGSHTEQTQTISLSTEEARVTHPETDIPAINGFRQARDMTDKALPITPALDEPLNRHVHSQGPAPVHVPSSNPIADGLQERHAGKRKPSCAPPSAISESTSFRPISPMLPATPDSPFFSPDLAAISTPSDAHGDSMKPASAVQPLSRFSVGSPGDGEYRFSMGDFNPALISRPASLSLSRRSSRDVPESDRLAQELLEQLQPSSTRDAQANHTRSTPEPTKVEHTEAATEESTRAQSSVRSLSRKSSSASLRTAREHHSPSIHSRQYRPRSDSGSRFLEAFEGPDSADVQQAMDTRLLSLLEPQNKIIEIQRRIHVLSTAPSELRAYLEIKTQELAAQNRVLPEPAKPTTPTQAPRFEKSKDAARSVLSRARRANSVLKNLGRRTASGLQRNSQDLT